MKKLLGLTALIFALSPLAQAQSKEELLRQHPDARNDRTAAEVSQPARASSHHRHHAKRHVVARHRHKAAHRQPG